MKKSLVVLTDYKNYFGSKWNASPYNSGFNLSLLEQYLSELNISINIVKFSLASTLKNIDDKIIIYTSSEDIGYLYKSYIEDVVLFLQSKGAKVLPNYDFLRANNNKVYMEYMRHKLGHLWGDSLKSWCFGTYEEMIEVIEELPLPIVIKTAEGAMSKGVFLAKSKKELLKKVKSISRSKHIFQDVKDNLRPIKHKGYKTESLYRNKFILQTFIPNLKNDWKILIYGDKYFILTRHVGKGDFRASGSKVNYLAGSKSILPQGLLDFAKKVYDSLNVPHLSIDVVHDGSHFHLIEFQAVYFGSTTVYISDVYYIREEGKWKSKVRAESIEELYADSLIHYLKKSKKA
jgi:hypothetical protein